MTDPHINGRCIRVVFDNEDYNYLTSINGSRDSICRYFRGELLNVASFPDEMMVSPVRIEFLNADSDPVVVDLSMSQQRAADIIKAAIERASCGPWSDQLRKVMTDSEVELIKFIFGHPVRPGSSSFASTLCTIQNGNLNVDEFLRIYGK